MKFFLMCLASLISVFTLANSHAADLGSGYSCDGGKIFRKGKEVRVANAVSSVQSQIDKLGSSKKNKSKKATLNALKKALKNCSKSVVGTPTPAPGGGAIVDSVYGARARTGFFNTGPISGFGDTPAFGTIQIKRDSNATYLITFTIGENGTGSQRFFGDFEPGPFSDFSGTEKMPFSKSDASQGGTKTISVESSKITFTFDNIAAGITRNGATITKVEVVLTLAENNGYTGTLKYFNGATAVVSGTFTVQ
jgi:hypothetical protein